MRPHGDEDGVEAAVTLLGGQILDPVAAGHLHTQCRDPLELGAEDLTGQPVGRDAVAHHPTRLVPGVPDLDLVTQTGEVVRRGQPTRPGAHDEHPFAGTARWRGQRPSLLHGQVPEEALHGVDRDRAVELGAIAHLLTGVVADAPVDRRQGVVGDEGPPGLLVTAGFHVCQPGLDVLTGRTARIARRKQVHVNRAPAPDRPGPGMLVGQVGQSRDVSRGQRAALTPMGTILVDTGPRCSWPAAPWLETARRRRGAGGRPNGRRTR